MDAKMVEMIVAVVAKCALDKTVKEVGDKAWEKGKELYAKVKGWLLPRPGGDLMVKKLAEGKESAPALLKEELTEGLASDPAFAEELKRLFAEYEQAAGNLAINTGSGAVVQGNNNVVACRGGVAVGGNVHGDVSVHGGGRPE